MLQALCILIVLCATPCLAQQANIRFENCFEIVSETQREQPSWMTPLVTSSPRLEQEFRFDALKQGSATDINGAGQGLDIIPAERIQIVLGAPPFGRGR